MAFSGLFCYGVGSEASRSEKYVRHNQFASNLIHMQVDFGNLSQIPNFHVNSIAFSQIITSLIFEFS